MKAAELIDRLKAIAPDTDLWLCYDDSEEIVLGTVSDDDQLTIILG
jgi:hypothetical protein